jgi:hypothetical protein
VPVGHQVHHRGVLEEALELQPALLDRELRVEERVVLLPQLILDRLQLGDGLLE